LLKYWNEFEVIKKCLRHHIYLEMSGVMNRTVPSNNSSFRKRKYPWTPFTMEYPSNAVTFGINLFLLSSTLILEHYMTRRSRYKRRTSNSIISQLLSKEEAILLEEYKLIVRLQTYEGETYWGRFNVFLAINSVILTVLMFLIGGVFVKHWNLFMVIVLIICVLGVIITLSWFS